MKLLTKWRVPVAMDDEQRLVVGLELCSGNYCEQQPVVVNRVLGRQSFRSFEIAFGRVR